MIILRVENVFTDIEGYLPAEHYSELQKKLSFFPNGYEFSTQYNTWIKDSKGKSLRRAWDGRKRQIWRNKKKTYFPTGLFSLVKEYLEKHNIPFSMQDDRKKPTPSLNLKFSENKKLRDYQLNQVVIPACNKQRGIIQLATGAGKTVCAAGIIQKLNVSPFIFFVTSIDLLTQAKESFEDFLQENGTNLKVGQIGGGIVDIQNINVMTIQTAVRAIGEKWNAKYKFDSSDQDDKTPIQERRKDILNLLRSAKGAIGDEIQHWRADTCQLVVRELKNCYYTYGASVSPDSFLHITEDGYHKYGITIEELYNRYAINNEPVVKVPKLWVESVDTKKLCPSWCKVKAILKHESKNPILHISVPNGHIELSTDHSVFVLKNDTNLNVCKGSDLKEGNILVSPLYQNHSGFKPKHLLQDSVVDIAEMFLNKLKHRELSRFIAVGFFPECQKNLHKKIDPQEYYRFFNRKKYHYLPFDIIKTHGLYKHLKEKEFHIRSKGKSNVFSKTISSVDLCFLAGLILGDGDIGLTRIGLSLGSKEEYIIVSTFMKQLGLKEQLYKRGKVYYVRYNNSTLSMLLKILGLHKKCCEKDIPKELFSFGITGHRKLVQGLLLTDGHLSQNDSRRRETFQYTTRSRNLASGIHALFRIHGTLISIQRRDATKRFQTRKVNSCIDRDFVLSCSTSSSPLLDNIYGLSFSQHRIPTTLDFLQKRIKHHKIYQNRKYLRLDEFEHIINLSPITKRQELLCRGFKLLPIKSIKTRKEKYVYDLSVQKTENFLANGILVHNSATPYRDDGDDMMIQACFGKKIVEISASKLIQDEWLIKPTINIVDIKGPVSKYRQWQQIYKDQVSENKEYNNIVASITNSYIKNNRLILVLVQHIVHGKRLAEIIPGSVFLSGSSSKKKRQEGINQLRQREISCIVSSVIFDEGIDVKPLDTLILAGQGRSKVRAMQRIGRILRPSEGKTQATAIDFRIHQKYLLEHSKAREKMYKTEPEFNIQHIDPGNL